MQTTFSVSDIVRGCGSAGAGGLSGLGANRLFQQMPQEAAAQTNGRSMFSEIRKDVSNFISEYRGVIYFVALALIVDHLLLNGTFRTRLQAMLEKLIAKVEERVA